MPPRAAAPRRRLDRSGEPEPTWSHTRAGYCSRRGATKAPTSAFTPHRFSAPETYASRLSHTAMVAMWSPSFLDEYVVLVVPRGRPVALQAVAFATMQMTSTASASTALPPLSSRFARLMAIAPVSWRCRRRARSPGAAEHANHEVSDVRARDGETAPQVPIERGRSRTQCGDHRVGSLDCGPERRPIRRLEVHDDGSHGQGHTAALPRLRRGLIDLEDVDPF